MAKSNTQLVSMHDVARSAGVHQTTVSRALRNDPRLPLKTRERIRRLADDLGYRPHPYLSALLAFRRARQPARSHAAIAFVARDTMDPSHYRLHLGGARKLAERCGFKVDLFQIGEHGFSEERLRAVLRARNVRGVIIGPLPEAHDSFQLDWQNLGVVAIEYTFARPEFDRVVHDNYDGMRQIMQQCRQRGWRRVGLVLTQHGHERTDWLYDAAFWAEQKRDDFFVPIPPLTMSLSEPVVVDTWIRQHDPEVIVTQNMLLDLIDGRSSAWESAAGRTIHIINVNALPAHRHGGIVQDSQTIGAVAAKIVIEKIVHNECGVPKVRTTTLTPGMWTEGDGAEVGDRRKKALACSIRLVDPLP